MNRNIRMMGVILCAAITRAASLSAAETPQVRPSEAYEQKNASEYLKVSRISPEEISFCMDLVVGKSAHICSLGGIAVRQSGDIYQYKQETCELTLTKTPKAWRVSEDASQSCSRIACGANASIGRRTYLFTSRLKTPHACLSEGE